MSRSFGSTLGLLESMKDSNEQDMGSSQIASAAKVPSPPKPASNHAATNGTVSPIPISQAYPKQDRKGGRGGRRDRQSNKESRRDSRGKPGKRMRARRERSPLSKSNRERNSSGSFSTSASYSAPLSYSSSLSSAFGNYASSSLNLSSGYNCLYGNNFPFNMGTPYSMNYPTPLMGYGPHDSREGHLGRSSSRDRRPSPRERRRSRERRGSRERRDSRDQYFSGRRSPRDGPRMGGYESKHDSRFDPHYETSFKFDPRFHKLPMSSSQSDTRLSQMFGDNNARVTDFLRGESGRLNSQLLRESVRDNDFDRRGGSKNMRALGKKSIKKVANSSRKNNMKDLLKDESISKMNIRGNIRYYCNICKLNINSLSTPDDHVHSKVHRQNKYKKKTDKNSTKHKREEIRQQKRALQRKNFKAVKRAALRESKKEKEIESESKKLKDLIESVDGKHSCNACDFVGESLKDLRKHLLSDIHRIKIHALAGYACYRHEVTAGLTLVLGDRKGEAPFCHACKEVVVTNQHLESINHKIRVATRAEFKTSGRLAWIELNPKFKDEEVVLPPRPDQTIIPFEVRPAFWCNVCDVPFPDEEILRAHVQNQDHLITLEKIDDEEVVLSASNIPQILPGIYGPGTAQLGVVGKDLYCFLCEEMVCSATFRMGRIILEHYQSRLHKRKEALVSKQPLHEEDPDVREAGSKNGRLVKKGASLNEGESKEAHDDKGTKEFSEAAGVWPVDDDDQGPTTDEEGDSEKVSSSKKNLDDLDSTTELYVLSEYNEGEEEHIKLGDEAEKTEDEVVIFEDESGGELNDVNFEDQKDAFGKNENQDQEESDEKLDFDDKIEDVD